MRFLNSGESHGKGLIGIIEGFPANVEISIEHINKELERRQEGYGRGSRMKIERDKVEVFSGIRFGKTLGSPLSFLIKNKDWENWKLKMAHEKIVYDKDIIITKPRPGHADLSGAIKYRQEDVRNILERASARETASRTVVGAFSKQLLKYFDIQIKSRVKCIGTVMDNKIPTCDKDWIKIRESELSVLDKTAEEQMKSEIDKAKEIGETLGGIIEVVITNLPIGLGSHVNYDRKIDGKLAQAVMSIQSVKGVEIGDAFKNATKFGGQVHDELYYKNKYYRKTNNAGGVEGGMTNGESIIVRAAVKPIPTLMSPLKSIDMKTKESFDAVKERSDVCAVPAAGVVMENAVAWTIACEMAEKFGSDSIEEMYENYISYTKYVQTR